MPSPTVAYVIDAATEADIPALVALENASFSTDRLGIREFRRFLRGGTAVLVVARTSSAVAGYGLVIFRRNSRYARLYSIAVDADARGSRLGERLLQAIEKAARERGAVALRLEVRPENDAAIRLYERNGYCRFGVIHAFYEDGCDALRFEKALAD